MAPHQDTQTRSRLSIGEDGPSDSALAAARDGRLRRPAAERHAARCASRVLCSGGAPRRYSPSAVQKTRLRDNVLGTFGTEIRHLCGELQKTSQKSPLLRLTFATQKPLN